MHEVRDGKVAEMLPDIFEKMPELCAKVGSVKLLEVVRGLLMVHDEPGCLSEDLNEWHLTQDDANQVFEIAKMFGCDFESGIWR